MRKPAFFEQFPARSILWSSLLLSACQPKMMGGTAPSPSTTPNTVATTPAAPLAPTPIPNPVVPGDFPDPSVVKVGDTYWATATTSNWGPVFPLLTSTNLTDWRLVGHVFPSELPAWADYYFWAPEISQDGGRTYVYYTAHQKGGTLAVGVASADSPAGPYRDHGPLVSQPAGSIDGFPMRDEKGELYLIWKEDGNSRNEPTPIWAQRLNDDRTALVGEKKELFRNTAPWEGNLVEGVSVVRHDDYFYAFYAANGCCGTGCTYATGVARAKSLLGPWEKFAQNPILTNNPTWACAGHGTAIERDGRWFMLHHAYAAQNGFQQVGRQGVLSEFRWRADGWPEFLNDHSTPVAATPTPAPAVTDEFIGLALDNVWQWPVMEKPKTRVRNGRLYLTARPDHGAALGHQVYAANYAATTTLLNPELLPAGARAGLGALGDPANSLALTAGGGKLQLWQTREGKAQVLAETALPRSTTILQLRVQVQNGTQYRFEWSLNGINWTAVGPANQPTVDGAFLPPWDRGVRIGPVAIGPETTTAAFERFTLTTNP
jgi:xylan 1,4-beta-xylosidase